MFQKHKLSELGSIARGKSKHRPRNDSRLFGGKYPFIQTADIKNANFYVSSYIETYNDFGLSQSKLWEKDTLCLTIAANIAETALLSFQACFPDSIVGFISDPNKSDVKFVKYALDFEKKKFQTSAKGTTQDNLSLDKINTLKIYSPNLEHQKRISSVINAYDQLIENNEKRIKILEEMAQRLYTEWFVKFKFPGYEKVKMVDSGVEFGMIPKEWKIKKLGDFINVRGGLSYKNEFLTGDCNELPLITMGCIHSRSLFNYSGLGYYSGEYGKNHVLKSGDLVMATRDVTSERKILGSPAIVPNIYKKAIAATNIYIVDNLVGELNNQFLYLLFRGSSFRARMIGHATGTNILMIVKDSVLGFTFVSPEKNVLSKFLDIINPIFIEMENLETINQNLSKIRDLLIPQLVTGKMEVKN